MSVPRLVILDLDGTLFRGETPIDGAVEAVGKLQQADIGVAFLTNNSSKTRTQTAEKLMSMGFEAEPDRTYTSSWGAARYAKSKGIQRVLAIGEGGLKASLVDAGIELTDHQPDAVISGICRDFCYQDMNRALQAFIHGALYIATNRDATYPVENDGLIPGSGAIVASLELLYGSAPVVIGKPEPYLIEAILQDFGVSANETLVVGDRFETDIVAGQRSGCRSLMVLSGVTPDAPEGVPSIASVADLPTLIGLK